MANYTAGFDTRAVHVGAECDPGTGAVVSPIYLASTYGQDGVGKNKASYSTLCNRFILDLNSRYDRAIHTVVLIILTGINWGLC
jgi:cystathionine beta-lyase/cystathionine gamma-synthase